MRRRSTSAEMLTLVMAWIILETQLGICKGIFSYSGIFQNNKIFCQFWIIYKYCLLLILKSCGEADDDYDYCDPDYLTYYSSFCSPDTFFGNKLQINGTEQFRDKPSAKFCCGEHGYVFKDQCQVAPFILYPFKK